MKKILCLLILFSLPLRVLALEIVYPKTNPVKIQSASTFFIGSAKADEPLYINNEKIPVAPNGGFAFPVKLECGLNIFKIKNGAQETDFVIERIIAETSQLQKPVLTEFPPVKFIVIKDNIPLRKTPIDGGINRLSHLEGQTTLLIDGEQGDFYRVYLASNQHAWVSKNDVSILINPICDNNSQENIKLVTDETKSEYIFKIKTNRKLPYIISDDNGLSINLYNVEGYKDGIYSFALPKENTFGYDVSYKDDNMVIKVKKSPKIDSQKPLNDIIITLDPGHGGTEYGAIGCCGDKEKDINLAISNYLKQELLSRGAKVYMTRESDINVSLADRISYAKEKNTQILLSIHANALPDGGNPLTTRGTSVYYYHPQSKPLADCILNSMTTQSGTKDDKVRQGSLALVRPTFCISNLIEVAYIINPDDYTLLLNPDFQKKCAKAIADGIENYLKN